MSFNDRFQFGFCAGRQTEGPRRRRETKSKWKKQQQKWDGIFTAEMFSAFSTFALPKHIHKSAFLARNLITHTLNLLHSIMDMEKRKNEANWSVARTLCHCSAASKRTGIGFRLILRRLHDELYRICCGRKNAKQHSAREN